MSRTEEKPESERFARDDNWMGNKSFSKSQETDMSLSISTLNSEVKNTEGNSNRVHTLPAQELMGRDRGKRIRKVVVLSMLGTLDCKDEIECLLKT